MAEDNKSGIGLAFEGAVDFTKEHPLLIVGLGVGIILFILKDFLPGGALAAGASVLGGVASEASPLFNKFKSLFTNEGHPAPEPAQG